MQFLYVGTLHLFLESCLEYFYVNQLFIFAVSQASNGEAHYSKVFRLLVENILKKATTTTTGANNNSSSDNEITSPAIANQYLPIPIPILDSLGVQSKAK